MYETPGPHGKVIRYSSDCSSVLSPDDPTAQHINQDAPANPKTLTGNGSDSSGIDVSCENIPDIDRSKSCQAKSSDQLKSSKIPTPKSKIPSIVSTPNTGMKRTVRIKSQSSESLNNQSNFNRRSADSVRPDNLTPSSGPARRRSTSQVVMSAPTTRMPRSRSASGEQGLAHNYNLFREGPGRFSYRTPRPADFRSEGGNKTWTFRQRNNRPTLSYETYMSPTLASQQRRVSSESPNRRIPLRSADNFAKISPVRKVSQSASTSPSKNLSPLLQEILSSETDLSDDSKILQKMEMIVNQYKARVEANLKRKETKENARWNSTGDLSDEGYLNPVVPRGQRKLSAPPSPVSVTDPLQNLDISARPRRDTLGSSSGSKIPMPRWYTKKL